MEPAFGYTRVSGHSQIDGDGHVRQTEAIHSFASKCDYQVLQVFREDAVPGKSELEDRPQFQAMIAECLAQGVTTIVVEALDRLAREYRVQEQLLIYLATKGFSLIAANTGENVTEALMGDPMRRALVQIQGILAELDKNLIVSKLMKARKRKRENGGRCEGQPRYGWRALRENGESKLVEVPNEQAVIETVKTLNKNGWKSSDIAAELNKADMKPRYGDRWHPMQIRRILKGPETPQQSHDGHRSRR